MIDAHVFDRILLIAASVSPPLRDAIARLGPITVLPPAHAGLAERLFVEVVNQQLSTRAALAIWARIEAASAERALAPRDLFVPGYEAVLRTCGVSANKIRALQAVRAAEEAGLFADDLAAMPHPERSALLCRVRGIGPWTADMVGIFHFLDPDIWPAGDVAAMASLRRLTGRDDIVTLAAAFSPYRSILARYAWRLRDEAMALA